MSSEGQEHISTRWTASEKSQSTKLGSESGWNLPGANTTPSGRRVRKPKVLFEPEETPCVARVKKPRVTPQKEKRKEKMSNAEFLKGVYKIALLQKETALTTFDAFLQQADVTLQNFARAVVTEYKGFYKKRMEQPSEAYPDTWLDEDRLMLLDQIGFPWPEERRSPWQEEQTFQNHVRLLAAYKAKHGDLLVPFDYQQDPNLAQWVDVMREEEELLRKGSQTTTTCYLNQERRDLLNAMGFAWDYSRSFQEKIRELKAYNQEQQQENPPRNKGKGATTEDGKASLRIPTAHSSGTLGKWCSRMRSFDRQLKMGTFQGSDHLRQQVTQRLEWLKRIGFPFKENPKADLSWEDRFRQLVEYKQRFGHCNVPQHWPENKTLGEWVNKQRTYHNETREKRRISQDQVQKLESIGFAWKLRDRFFDQDWETRLTSLQAFHRAHDQSCDVPSPYPEDPLLSKWVVRVREEYRKYKAGKPSKMTDDRIKSLEKMDFQWETKS